MQTIKLFVNTLDERVLPAQFLWSVETSNNDRLWSNPRNWDLFNNTLTMYQHQSTLVLGVGDTVVFGDVNNPLRASTNDDCIVDVLGGVTVKNVSVVSGYFKV